MRVAVEGVGVPRLQQGDSPTRGELCSHDCSQSLWHPLLSLRLIKSLICSQATLLQSRHILAPNESAALYGPTATFGYLSKGTKSRNLNVYLCTRVCSSIIHKSPKVGLT